MEWVPGQWVSDVKACAFDNWGKDGILAEAGFASEVLRLPEGLVERLLSDGVRVRSGNEAIPERREWSMEDMVDSQVPSDDDGDEEGTSQSSHGGDIADIDDYPEFSQEVRESIQRLGGAVFPKLNWSSPKDARWITCDGSLRCTTPDDVFLLFKCSDCIRHDLEHAFDNCRDGQGGPHPSRVTLVLKRYHETVHPGSEFRCFCKAGRFLGACQRDTGTFYPFLVENGKRESFLQELARFHDEVFGCGTPVEDACYDVVVLASGDVRLVDVNPYGGATLPLLFTWEELDRRAWEQIPPDLRVIEEQVRVR